MVTMEGVRTQKQPFRNVYIYFALLFPAALLAFAKYYFAGVTFSGKPLTVLVHVHAALMTLWLSMLVAQAWFIRTRRFRQHRWVGRSSYVIAPVIIVATLLAVLGERNINAVDARTKIFGLGMTMEFAVTWGLAILYRRRTSVHVRFIISTTFAMGSAVVFRILRNWFGWVPGLESLEGLAVANVMILVLPLLALIASDWRAGLRLSPFWVVTILIGVMHLGYFTFAKTDGWFAFVQWLAALPLPGS